MMISFNIVLYTDFTQQHNNIPDNDIHNYRTIIVFYFDQNIKKGQLSYFIINI